MSTLDELKNAMPALTTRELHLLREGARRSLMGSADPRFERDLVDAVNAELSRRVLVSA